jgi:hypothetical protein
VPAPPSDQVVANMHVELLPLYYDDKIGPDLFAEEEARLSVAVREAKRETEAAHAELARSDDVAGHFEEVVAMLTELDIDRTWAAATDLERPVLLDELLEEVTVLPGYLNVTIHGAPPLHISYQEVGMKESVLIVSEGLVEQNPIGGSSPGTWESRRPNAAWCAVPVTQHPQTASEFSLRACHSCMRLKQAHMGVWITGSAPSFPTTCPVRGE